MKADFLGEIIHLLPNSILKDSVQTERGFLLCPNADVAKGPKYLIQLNAPLGEDEFEWEDISPFLNGGNEKMCREFFKHCNGFSFGRQFTAPGILVESAYHWEGLSSYLHPYDLRTLANGSYPEFAPPSGYFVSKLRRKSETVEICDVITSGGQIVSGAFRENTEIKESFDDFGSWIRTRIPQALMSMRKMNELTLP